MPYSHSQIFSLVEVSPQVAASRRDKRGLVADRYEVDELQVQIAQRYANICQEYQAHRVNGNLTLDEVTNACLQPLKTLIDMTSTSPKYLGDKYAYGE